jgi:ubiquinone/menaquinone biosynthesis C-methylase UbiE
MAITFSHRSAQEEIMDDLACDGEVVDQTLRELDVINQWLGGNAVTLNAVKKLLATSLIQKELTIADLGCGSGQMLRLLARMVEKKNRKATLVGIDANPNIIRYAQQQSKEFPQIQYLENNILEQPFAQKKFDVVLATLFFHHFSTDDLIRVLRQLAEQTRFIVINDIHRHPFAYYSIKWLTRLFSKSAMVKFDAPLSVLRSFTKQEWLYILQQAGFTQYQIHWKWAFRWQLIIATR